LPFVAAQKWLPLCELKKTRTHYQHDKQTGRNKNVILDRTQNSLHETTTKKAEKCKQWPPAVAAAITTRDQLREISGQLRHHHDSTTTNITITNTTTTTGTALGRAANPNDSLPPPTAPPLRYPCIADIFQIEFP